MQIRNILPQKICLLAYYNKEKGSTNPCRPAHNLTIKDKRNCSLHVFSFSRHLNLKRHFYDTRKV
uniref:Uncharacterized protein n=1 Tax=Arundo donax TaxID=35708 RepID=A0A0A9GYV5_ARUDO